MYKAMASRISVTVMYSSAVWEREVHQRLVGERRRSERYASQDFGFGHNGMVLVYARRIQAERAGFHFTADMGAGCPVDFFVGVVLIAAYVYGESALVWHDVVLRAGMDDRHAHFHVSQER